MDDGEVESSTNLPHDAFASTRPAADEAALVAAYEAAEHTRLEQIARDSKLRAQRKRVGMLEHLLMELDKLVLLQLITIYYLECVADERRRRADACSNSFFWLCMRACLHVAVLTPLPPSGPQRDDQHDFLFSILLPFAVCASLHATYPAPSAGETARFYLHGGLLMDLIGQKGPTSRWRLAALDACVVVLQLVMASVHVKHRALKKPLQQDHAPAQAGDGAAGGTTAQDLDAEERGVLRRTDSLSGGSEPDSDGTEDGLSARAIGGGGLESGQAVVADLFVWDAMVQEHARSQAAERMRARSHAADVSLAPLQQLRAALQGG